MRDLFHLGAVMAGSTYTKSRGKRILDLWGAADDVVIECLLNPLFVIGIRQENGKNDCQQRSATLPGRRPVPHERGCGKRSKERAQEAPRANGVNNLSIISTMSYTHPLGELLLVVYVRAALLSQRYKYRWSWHQETALRIFFRLYAGS
jgi:hypothetical protein